MKAEPVGDTVVQKGQGFPFPSFLITNDDDTIFDLTDFTPILDLMVKTLPSWGPKTFPLVESISLGAYSARSPVAIRVSFCSTAPPSLLPPLDPPM